MGVVKFAEAGFAVMEQEIKKENYLEVKLRKGVELDEEACKVIASRISPKYHGGIFFEGGVTLAFERWGSSNAHLLGIALEKEGVIKNPKLGILKSALVGHPAVTYYNVTYAIPDDIMMEKLEKAAEGMQSFRMEIVKKEPMFGKIKMKLDGDVWVGEAQEESGVRKLEVRKDGGHLKLRVEVKSRSGTSDAECTFTSVDRAMRITDIRMNKPQWVEGIEIKPREMKKSLKESIENGEGRRLATGLQGVNLFEVKKKVKSNDREVIAKYSVTEKGTLMRVDFINGNEVPPVSIRPNKLRNRMREFATEEVVREWFGNKEAVE
ncbi:hypothetical protein H0N99_01030 [Candidatus Micrarchaeota archaeon]|nr:hypothetical protein [Candidatus Micrarchaeota archaeon]